MKFTHSFVSGIHKYFISGERVGKEYFYAEKARSLREGITPCGITNCPMRDRRKKYNCVKYTGSGVAACGEYRGV